MYSNFKLQPAKQVSHDFSIVSSLTKEFRWQRHVSSLLCLYIVCVITYTLTLLNHLISYSIWKFWHIKHIEYLKLWSVVQHKITQSVCWAFSTEFLNKEITWAGSGAPNTELPATMQFAPADAAMSIVEGPKPPSTCNWNWHVFIIAK